MNAVRRILLAAALTALCACGSDDAEAPADTGAPADTSAVDTSEPDSAEETSPRAPFPTGIEEGEATFENFDGGTVCTLGRNLLPADRDEAIAAVRWAIDQGYRVKAVSSPASHSEQDIVCPEAGGVQINFRRMNRVIAIDEDAMEVTVEPGAFMGDVSAALHVEGLGFENHIPWLEMTAAGVIATGAHHTSLRFPSGPHDAVKRLELIDGQGELVTLEGVEAKGAAAHLGVLGAVVSVTFEVVPQFKVRATVVTGSDEGLEDTIVQMARDLDYASFSWFVSQGSYTVRRNEIVDASTPGEAWSTNWHSTEQEQRTQLELANGINRSETGETEICAIATLRSNDDSLSHADADGSKSGEAVGWSHVMFSSVCHGTECPWNIGLRIYNPEVALPVDQLPAWMRRVRELHAANPHCYPLNGIVIRFSKAGESYLAMNAGQDVAYIEHHVARHPDDGHHEPHSDAHDELQQLTMREFDARPHWGKNSPATFEGFDPSKRYPKWAEFVALKQRLDPNGVYDNAFWKRLTEGGEPIRTDECAAKRDCWCETDAHCGEGRKCVPGYVDPDARICLRASEVEAR